MSDVDTLHREVKRAYRARRKAPRLWLSEFTVSARRDNRAFSFFVSERRAGAVGHRRLPDRLHRNGTSPGLGWYTLLDEPDGAAEPDQRPARRRRQAEARLQRLPQGLLSRDALEQARAQRSTMLARA